MDEITPSEMYQIFSLQAINPGAYSGCDWVSEIQPLDVITSYNPSTKEALAKISSCTEEDYETVMQRAEVAFLAWRKVPAPKRGEVIRKIGDVLRQNKDCLGTLIALEMGKSKQEADGEVQEMIDMADFSVGQSRMLYGKTMHSERPAHRMYEQWHPLGVVGVITSFNFPMAVWAWNAFIAVIAGNTVIWKPSSKTPLCALAVQHICNDVMKKYGFSSVFSIFITDDNQLANHLVKD